MCDQRVADKLLYHKDTKDEVPPKTDINLSSRLSGENLDVQTLSEVHNFEPEHIRKLVLTRNVLSVLPSSIAQFAELKELDVSTNALTWISGEQRSIF